jgi:hypothetical protein
MSRRDKPKRWDNKDEFTIPEELPYLLLEMHEIHWNAMLRQIKHKKLDHLTDDLERFMTDEERDKFHHHLALSDLMVKELKLKNPNFKGFGWGK